MQRHLNTRTHSFTLARTHAHHTHTIHTLLFSTVVCACALAAGSCKVETHTHAHTHMHTHTPPCTHTGNQPHPTAFAPFHPHEAFIPALPLKAASQTAAPQNATLPSTGSHSSAPSKGDRDGSSVPSQVRGHAGQRVCMSGVCQR